MPRREVSQEVVLVFSLVMELLIRLSQGGMLCYGLPLLPVVALIKGRLILHHLDLLCDVLYL
jgi:hypothetical protein